MHPFKTYNLMSFSIFIKLCNHHPLIPEHYQPRANGIILISFNGSLLLHINTILFLFFFTFFMYPSTLVNTRISSNSSLEILRNFPQTDHGKKETVFPLPFQSRWLISFSCLNALSRTSYNVNLKRCDKARHPCLVPDLKGQAFSLYS